MSDDPFEFVGSKCGSRYGRTARRCLLPMFHEPRDHEDRKGSWHPKPFHKLGDVAAVEPIEQSGAPT